MKYSRIVFTVYAMYLPFYAEAATVFPACSTPAFKSGYHTFFVDPVNGSPSGDGSAAHPWRTLEDVLDPTSKLVATQGHAGAAYSKGTDLSLHAVNPNGPIKAGDLILLRSGDHGAVTLTNMFNNDFITVAAAPGAVPVIDQLAVISSSKWMFQGLTFQGMASEATGATKVTASTASLVSTGLSDWEGQTSDIVFDHNTFQTATSTNGWTDFDWLSKPYGNAIRANAPCTSLTANHVTNVLNAVAVTAEKVLVQGNTIDNFSNDAIEIASSNLLVKNNVIKGGVNTNSDPWHADGIQGWSLIVNGVTATNKNVVIDGNTIVKTGDPLKSYMQGISIFDGKWDNLTIQNNVVAVNTWNSLTVFGAQNSRILNNTVIAAYPPKYTSWIQVANAKDGTVSSGVTVRNNIATQFDIAKGNIIFDHNIAAGWITTYPSGTKSVISSGSTGTANSVLPAVLSGFMTLDTNAGTFDLRLRPTSVAVGFGTATGAPALDILGKSRTAPVDVGAYVH